MNVKQIKWHVAVLAVTVITALAAVFALTTVTSHAAEVIKKQDDQGNWTYIMSDSTYDKQIVLEEGTTTTIEINGENKLTYGGKWGSCINGRGNLVITGDGTLDAHEREMKCYDFTIKDGAKLKIGYDLYAYGTVTVDNADIEAIDGYMYCGYSYSDPRQKHVFNNARLYFTSLGQTGYYTHGLTLNGDFALNNCNVTLVNSPLFSHNGEININGGTYNITLNETNKLYSTLLSVDYKLIANNTIIKTNACCNICSMEMTDSNFEITSTSAPSGSSGKQIAALQGEYLVFSGSKLNIDTTNEHAGIYAKNLLIIAGNTEANVKGLGFGIVGKDVQITHSAGKIQATDPAESVAAITAYTIPDNPSGSVTPGTLTLKSVTVEEPAGGTVGDVKVNRLFDPVPSGSTAEITTILNGNASAKSVVLEVVHNWDAGKVTKQPTTTDDGVKTFTCSSCGATKTESIPKLTPQDSQAASKGEDGTPFGKGASVTAAEAAILALPDDNDPAGTAFGLLQLKASKVTKNSVKLNWKAVPGATKYILFANKCGTGNKYKKLGEVTGTSYTATQAAGAAIQKGTYYKFMMIAADSSGRVITTSKTVHAATKGGKVGNHKKVTVKKSVTKKAKKLKRGKTIKLKAKAVPQAKKLKVRKHRGIMYESSNPAVAQVNGKGKVKGVGKGTCYIYAYAQNGTCAKVKVTVK